MGVPVEVGITQVRHFGLVPVELDDVGVVHIAEVAPGTALVGPEQRRDKWERGLVHVEGGWRALPYSRAAAGPIDRGSIARAEQQSVCCRACELVAREQ